MADIEQREASSLIIRAVATDGGTTYVEATIEGQDGYFFYIDGRVGSNTRGEIYYASPHLDGAAMMKSDCALAQSIKRLKSVHRHRG